MIEAWLTALQGSELALILRFSRWGYAFVNTAHVLGIALLVGAIVPLDLRLFGLWSSIDRAVLVRVLVPVAAVGLILAVTAGFLLFSARAVDYAALPLFRIKLLLILAGSSSALALHFVHGRLLDTASRPRLAHAAALSMINPDAARTISTTSGTWPRIAPGYGPHLPASSQFALTVPSFLIGWVELGELPHESLNRS